MVKTVINQMTRIYRITCDMGIWSKQYDIGNNSNDKNIRGNM